MCVRGSTLECAVWVKARTVYPTGLCVELEYFRDYCEDEQWTRRSMRASIAVIWAGEKATTGAGALFCCCFPLPFFEAWPEKEAIDAGIGTGTFKSKYICCQAFEQRKVDGRQNQVQVNLDSD